MPGAGNQTHAAPWREGAVLASVAYGGSTPGNMRVVAVTDDLHTTLAVHSFPELAVCMNGVSVVAAPDGNSVYVGYVSCPVAEVAYAVSRFDCTSE